MAKKKTKKKKSKADLAKAESAAKARAAKQSDDDSHTAFVCAELIRLADQGFVVRDFVKEIAQEPKRPAGSVARAVSRLIQSGRVEERIRLVPTNPRINLPVEAEYQIELFAPENREKQQWQLLDELKNRLRSYADDNAVEREEAGRLSCRPPLALIGSAVMYSANYELVLEVRARTLDVVFAASQEIQIPGVLRVTTVFKDRAPENGHGPLNGESNGE